MSPHNMRLQSSKNRKVFLLAMLWGWFALIWAYFALLASAFGAETTINGRSFNFEPPAGHCLLNEQGPKDCGAIEALQQIQKPEGSIIWMFADCHELAQLHAGQTSQLKHFGHVMAVQSSGGYQPAASMSRSSIPKISGAKSRLSIFPAWRVPRKAAPPLPMRRT